MDLISTKITEIASLGLDGLSARHKAIASNIANADTPGYRRIDVSFEDQLNSIIQTEDKKDLQRLRNSADPDNMAEMYNLNNKQSQAPSGVDYRQTLMEMSSFRPKTTESNENPPDKRGNTVNIEQEMGTLAKNGMTYDALATMEAKEFKELSDVIRG